MHIFLDQIQIQSEISDLLPLQTVLVYNLPISPYLHFTVTTINYPISFPTTPVLIVLPSGQSYNDTFSLTLRYSTASSFKLNTDRVDQPGGSWGQDLQFDYLAVIFIGKYFLKVI